MAELLRLNKYISDSGLCSRREADKYIEFGLVKINGRKVGIGIQVNPYKDIVMVNGMLIEPKKEESLVLMAFNKPVGITTTTEIGVKDNIVDFIGYHERIFHIGRLDKDSQGLIFMTNDGNIVNKILRAGNNHEKEYVVTVDKPITDDFVEKMQAGVPILGTMTKKCKVVKESVFVFKIILVQGLNRQIRRMCEFFGYEVVKLERIRIMNVSLKGIGIGDWRFVEGQELEHIRKAIANSSEDAPSAKQPSKKSQSSPSSQSSKPSRSSSGSSKSKSQGHSGNASGNSARPNSSNGSRSSSTSNSSRNFSKSNSSRGSSSSRGSNSSRGKNVSRGRR